MILNRYERMVARRYLLPGKGEGFIFLVATISLVAVALGVAALIIVMSVMNGFRAELFDKIVGLNGHAVVQGYNGRLADWRNVLKDVKATPGVTEASLTRLASLGIDLALVPDETAGRPLGVVSGAANTAPTMGRAAPAALGVRVS